VENKGCEDDDDDDDNNNNNNTFSGYRPCQFVKITDLTGTISVPMIRVIK